VDNYFIRNREAAPQTRKFNCKVEEIDSLKIADLSRRLNADSACRIVSPLLACVV
jgi:hypothetical protein